MTTVAETGGRRLKTAMRWSLKQCATLMIMASLFLLYTLYQHANWTERLAQVALSCASNHTGAFHARALSSVENVIKLPFDDDTSRSAPEVKLLIVSYMRSGSSFTGAIFDQNNEAMYVYEPLLVLDGLLQKRRSNLPMFWDRSDIDPKVQEEVETLRDAILTGYFNCRLQDIFLEALLSKFQDKSDTTFLLVQCLQQHPGLLGVLHCLPILQQTCRQAKAVVIKTIRYSMQDAQKLMTADPQIKVLHLVRDPRATIQSQVEFGVFRVYGVKNYTRMFCERLLRDLQVGDAIARTFPDRLIRLRYEDLALHPLPYANKLLHFAGLRMSPAQEKDLEELTSTDVKNEFQVKFVKRTNSSAKVSQWRERANSHLAYLVDSYCAEVYTMAGYLPSKTAEILRDARVPLVLPVSSAPRFLN